MQNTFIINEEEVNSISICENYEPLIDLKGQDELAYGPPPDTPLTRDDYTKVRRTVYEKLCQAQKKLPDNWKFRIYEGLRSLNVQKILFDSLYTNLKLRDTSLSEEECFKQTSMLVAPVRLFNGSVNIPPHSTGGAIDIEMIDGDGNLVDLGMAIKDWAKVHPDICGTFSLIISEEATRNRKILLDIMHEHEFVNYPKEWWHFSYGDRLWAYLKKKKVAIYGGIS